MGAFETMQILITADSSGLQSEFTKVINFVKQSVSSINRESVDWVGILSGTVTPALLTGIATVFALSITNTLQAQIDALTARLNMMPTSQGGNAPSASDITAQAGAISDNTGQSLSDTTAALGEVSMAYKNEADAQLVASNIATFAAAEHMNLGDALNFTLPLLQQWNVSAADSANVLATLGESTSYGKIGVSDLSNTLAAAGPALDKLISLPDAIKELQTASAIPGLTPDAVENMFKTLVTGAQGTEPALNAIFGNIAKDITTGGLDGALGDINAKIKGLGSAAQLILPQFGLTANTISENMSVASKSFSDAATQAKNITTVPLQTWFEQNKGAVDDLKIAWQQFLDKITISSMPAFLKTFTDALTTLGDEMTGAKLLANDFSGAMETMSTGAYWNIVAQKLGDTAKDILGFGKAITDDIPGFNLLNALAGAVGKLIGGNGAVSDYVNANVNAVQQGTLTPTLPGQMQPVSSAVTYNNQKYIIQTASGPITMNQSQYQTYTQRVNQKGIQLQINQS